MSFSYDGSPIEITYADFNPFKFAEGTEATGGFGSFAIAAQPFDLPDFRLETGVGKTVVTLLEADFTCTFIDFAEHKISTLNAEVVESALSGRKAATAAKSKAIARAECVIHPVYFTHDVDVPIGHAESTSP